MAGLVLAFTRMLAGQILDTPELDGIAEICIGIIFSFIAAFLAYETKELFIGESVTPLVIEGINALLTMIQGF